jgi:hypothetical protein
MNLRPTSKSLKIALIAAVAVVIGCIGLSTVLPVRAFLPLKGAVEAPPAVIWTWRSLRSGALANSIGTWFDANVGLRSFWVRLDNQVNYTLFGELAKRTQGTVLIAGPGDWLFEKQYIDYATTPGSLADQELTRRIERMRRVEAKLARRSIPLVYMVAPSKVEVYPENVPAALLAANPPDRTSTRYEQAQAPLHNSGISFIDGPNLFRRWKQERVRDLFARSGTHWSYASALRIWEEIRAEMNPRLARPIPAFATIPTKPDRPGPGDSDLLNLANLLCSRPYQHPLIKPLIKPQADIPAQRLPKLLWVHDSFGWALIEELYEANAARPSDSLYYFRTHMKIPGGLVQDTKIEAIDWPSFLSDYDGIVLVGTEIGFEFDCWGFYETLDRALD